MSMREYRAAQAFSNAERHLLHFAGDDAQSETSESLPADTSEQKPEREETEEERRKRILNEVNHRVERVQEDLQKLPEKFQEEFDERLAAFVRENIGVLPEADLLAELERILSSFTQGMEKGKEEVKKEEEQQEAAVKDLRTELQELTQAITVATEEMLKLSPEELREMPPEQVEELLRQYDEQYLALQKEGQSLATIVKESADAKRAFDEEMQPGALNAVGAGTMIGGGAAAGAAVGVWFFGVGAGVGAAVGAGIGALAYLGTRLAYHVATAGENEKKATEVNSAFDEAREHVSSRITEMEEAGEVLSGAGVLLEGNLEQHRSETETKLEANRSALTGAQADVQTGQEQVTGAKATLIEGQQKLAEEKERVAQTKEELAGRREQIEQTEEAAKTSPEKSADLEKAKAQLTAQAETVEKAEQTLTEREGGVQHALGEAEEANVTLLIAEEDIEEQLSEAELQSTEVLSGMEQLEASVAASLFEKGLHTHIVLADASKQESAIADLHAEAPGIVENVWYATFEGFGQACTAVFKEGIADHLTEWTKDIPIINHIVGVVAGFSEGIGELGDGISRMIAHPVDTAKGLGALIGRDPETGEWHLGGIDPETGEWSLWAGGAGKAWKEMGKALIAYKDFEEENIGKGIGKIGLNILLTATGLGAAAKGVQATSIAYNIARAGGAGLFRAGVKAAYTGARVGSVELVSGAVRVPGELVGTVGRIARSPAAIIQRFSLSKAARLEKSITSMGNEAADLASAMDDAMRAGKLTDDLRNVPADKLARLTPEELTKFGVKNAKSVHAYLRFRQCAERASTLERSIALAEKAKALEEIQPGLSKLTTLKPEKLATFCEEMNASGKLLRERAYEVLHQTDNGFVIVDQTGMLRYLEDPAEISRLLGEGPAGNAARLKVADGLLGRSLSSAEQRALLEAHRRGPSISEVLMEKQSRVAQGLEGPGKTALRAAREKGHDLLGVFEEEWKARGIAPEQARRLAKAEVKKLMDRGIAGKVDDSVNVLDDIEQPLSSADTAIGSADQTVIMRGKAQELPTGRLDDILEGSATLRKEFSSKHATFLEEDCFIKNWLDGKRPIRLKDVERELQRVGGDRYLLQDATAYEAALNDLAARLRSPQVRATRTKLLEHLGFKKGRPIEGVRLANGAKDSGWLFVDTADDGCMLLQKNGKVMTIAPEQLLNIQRIPKGLEPGTTFALPQTGETITYVRMSGDGRCIYEWGGKKIAMDPAEFAEIMQGRTPKSLAEILPQRKTCLDLDRAKVHGIRLTKPGENLADVPAELLMERARDAYRYIRDHTGIEANPKELFECYNRILQREEAFGRTPPKSLYELKKEYFAVEEGWLPGFRDGLAWLDGKDPVAWTKNRFTEWRNARAARKGSTKLSRSAKQTHPFANPREKFRERVGRYAEDFDADGKWFAKPRAFGKATLDIPKYYVWDRPVRFLRARRYRSVEKLLNKRDRLDMALAKATSLRQKRLIQRRIDRLERRIDAAMERARRWKKREPREAGTAERPRNAGRSDVNEIKFTPDAAAAEQSVLAETVRNKITKAFGGEQHGEFTTEFLTERAGFTSSEIAEATEAGILVKGKRHWVLAETSAPAAVETAKPIAAATDDAVSAARVHRESAAAMTTESLRAEYLRDLEDLERTVRADRHAIEWHSRQIERLDSDIATTKDRVALRRMASARSEYIHDRQTYIDKVRSHEDAIARYQKKIGDIDARGPVSGPPRTLESPPPSSLWKRGERIQGQRIPTVDGRITPKSLNLEVRGLKKGDPSVVVLEVKNRADLPLNERLIEVRVTDLNEISKGLKPPPPPMI